MKKWVLVNLLIATLITLVVWPFVSKVTEEHRASPQTDAAVVALAAAEMPADGSSSIFGVVRERDSNKPVSATITARNILSKEVTEVQSAADGQYRVWVPSGEYHLTAEAEGYNRSLVANVGVHSHAEQNVELVPEGQEALRGEPGNPVNYVISQGVHDAGSAEAIASAQGYSVTGPAVYTTVSGTGKIAYRDGQAVATYDGNVNGPAWAVPTVGGITIYVVVDCGNAAKIVVETVVVLPPPPPPPPPLPPPPPQQQQQQQQQIVVIQPPPLAPTVPSTAIPKSTKTPVPPTSVPPTNTPVPTAIPLPTATRVSPTLWGSIRVEPDSGFGQILDADIIATVTGGTATGPINFLFDCQNDGVWDYQAVGVSETTYRVVDLCDYPTPNTYVAVVLMERDGVSGGASAHILVLPQ